MPDSIQAQITANLETALQTIPGVGTVEQMRSEWAYEIDDYPLCILIEEPLDLEEDYDDQQTITLGYTVMYMVSSHDGPGADPFTKQNRNVAADVTKAVMADRTQGGVAINTTIVGSGPTLFMDFVGGRHPATSVEIEVMASINPTNPYEHG